MPVNRNQTVVFATGTGTTGGFPGICRRDNTGAGSFDNYDVEAATAYGTEGFMWQDTNDVMYWGHPTAAWTMLGFYYHTAGSYGAHTWEYWNGSAWTSFTPQYDGTAGFTTHGYVVFGTLASWASTTVNGQAGFYVRASVASVTTAAKFYNFLLNLTIDAPHVLLPSEELELYVRDVNNILRERDVPTESPLELQIDCVARCISWASINLLRFLRSSKKTLTIYDEARTGANPAAPTSLPTVDSYYWKYTGRCAKVDEKVAAASKMQPASYSLLFHLDSATPILS